MCHDAQDRLAPSTPTLPDSPRSRPVSPAHLVDMNPNQDSAFAKDALFFSPHKFPGGVSTSGVLVVKKRLLANRVPTHPGGGTVFYVTEDTHRYLSNREEREEGGTPDIVGAIRTGLAFKVSHPSAHATAVTTFGYMYYQIL